MCHAICLINSGKAENATHVARSLQSITNQSLSDETIHTHLKKAGLKAVVKKKSPLLSKHPSIIMANPQVMWCSSRTMTQAHQQEGPDLVQRPWFQCHEVACSVTRPESH